MRGNAGRFGLRIGILPFSGCVEGTGPTEKTGSGELNSNRVFDERSRRSQIDDRGEEGASGSGQEVRHSHLRTEEVEEVVQCPRRRLPEDAEFLGEDARRVDAEQRGGDRQEQSQRLVDEWTR